MEFKVKLEQFEGPFDLLLHLVEKAEVDINEISISQITDEYLRYVEELEKLDLEGVSEFLVVAATLIDIKSRSLLPKRKKIISENEEIEDPREQLVRRLLEYKRYKEVSTILEEMAERQNAFHTRPPEVIKEKKGPVKLSLNSLYSAFQRALDKSPIKEEKPHEVKKEKITIDDKMVTLKKKLYKSKSLSFNDIMLECKSREEMVLTFLAMLELIRVNEISVTQKEYFGDIIIKAKKRGDENWNKGETSTIA
ncbi:segregation/condensation protein A [Proteinivorax hydrogeniformans]|uniref:Segregation and condensation protein A n=1 Tax=Proteinivorax hydrogeniformans TaxID=1826727 RepID=A0AAU8HQR5_9FIRM